VSLRPPVIRWLAGAWLAGALVAAAPAAASDTLDWTSLRPTSAAADNPFERLTPQQTDWITEIARGRLMQARGLPVGAEATARQMALSAALAAEGLDAEDLLRQRDALIAQRRTAAQAPVAAAAGREVRLVGHLLPASADGSTVTDWLFVPWAAACSHTPPPANQIIRIPAHELADVEGHGPALLVLTGRVDVREQESRLRFVDGELPLRSAYVVSDPQLDSLPAVARFSSPPGVPSR
jgi:hypothetical protein